MLLFLFFYYDIYYDLSYDIYCDILLISYYKQQKRKRTFMILTGHFLRACGILSIHGNSLKGA